MHSEISMSLFWGVLLGIILDSYLRCLILYVIGKCFYFCIHSLSFLFFTFSRDRKDKVHLSSGIFSLTCHISTGPRGRILTDKEDFSYLIICSGLHLFLSAAFFVLAFWGFPNPTDLSVDSSYSFWVGIAIGSLIHCIFLCILAIYVYCSRHKRVYYYYRNIRRLMSQGQPMETLCLPPVEQLTLTGSNGDMLYYLNLRFSHLVAREDYGALPYLAHQMESLLSYTYSEHEVPTYRNLLFYYSFIQYQPEKATHYYDYSIEKLQYEKESTSYRILAYYQYFVLQNPPLAKATAQVGLNAPDNYLLTKSEIVFEQKLLMNLINTIDTYFPQAQITQ